MSVVTKEQDALREKELCEIVDKALKEGKSYGSFSKQTFADGTKIRSYVERVHGGIIPFCELYGLPMDTLATIGSLIDYKASKLTEDEILTQIKELHKGLERGLMEKDVKSTFEGRVLVSAARRIYGTWNKSVLKTGIYPSIASSEIVEEFTPEIIQLYSSGKSIGKIEELVPVGFTAIKRVLLENGFNIIPATEWGRLNNPVPYTKQEVDEYVKSLLEQSVERKITVSTVKEDNPEMLRAIKHYHKTFSKAFINNGEYLLDKKVPKSWSRNFFISQLKLGAELGRPLNSSYFISNYPSVENYARQEFGSWENALIEAGIPLEDVYIGGAEFAKLGHKYEEVLRQILNELEYPLTNKPHDRWQPDFVVGNKWIDAKLSEYTHIGKDKNGLTVIEKYEPCCGELELVFLRGNYGTYRKLSDKTTLIHVSHYVNKLPKDRQEYYNAILTQIEQEANTIVYEQEA